MREKNKWCKIRNNETKLSLFVYGMILCQKKKKKSTGETIGNNKRIH